MAKSVTSTIKCFRGRASLRQLIDMMEGKTKGSIHILLGAQQVLAKLSKDTLECDGKKYKLLYNMLAVPEAESRHWIFEYKEKEFVVSKDDKRDAKQKREDRLKVFPATSGSNTNTAKYDDMDFPVDSEEHKFVDEYLDNIEYGGMSSESSEDEDEGDDSDDDPAKERLRKT